MACPGKCDARLQHRPSAGGEVWGGFLEGLERHEVRACGKHFPGLAAREPPSPAELALVSKPMAELWREDLVPYRALLPRLPLVC